MPVTRMVRRAISDDRSWAQEFALITVAVAIAAVLRLVIDRGSTGVQMATFFPVVVFSAILCRWQIAAYAAIMSLVVGVRLFMQPPESLYTRLVLVSIYLVTATVIIGMGQTLKATMRELEMHRDRVETFNNELHHRVKNVFQMVLALAAQGRNSDPSVYYANLARRIAALAKANELLGTGLQPTMQLSEAVQAAMESFGTAYSAQGEAFAISGEASTTLIMMLHELATNATKYGALSVSTGSVAISWSREADKVVLLWSESGGPLVSPPSRRGFGSKLLVPHRGVEAIETHFEPEGVRCRIVITG